MDQLKALAFRVSSILPNIKTEEATKTALIMPFIQCLGYNIHDLNEVTPEFTADIGTKKGEKVDFAILRDGCPEILFECKWAGTDLDKKHASQLYRYFSVTEAHFAVLTNGHLYRFFTDLDNTNKMDTKPFFEFNLLNFRESDLDELKKFCKSSFDLEGIRSAASELKHTSEVLRLIRSETVSPSLGMANFLAEQIYVGRKTQSVIEQFQRFSKNAFNQLIDEEIAAFLASARASGKEKSSSSKLDAIEDGPHQRAGVITTAEELQAYYMIKAMTFDSIDVSRIYLRDFKNHCSILIDDNRRKLVCKLYFDSTPKKIGFFDQGNVEEKFDIGAIDQLFQFREKILLAISEIDRAGKEGS